MKKLYKKFISKFKSDKGITGADITLAIIVISIFTGLIANLMYSNYRMSLDIQKAAIADAYATIILEKVDEKSFTEVCDTDFVKNLQKYNEIDIDENYTITYNVTDCSSYMFQVLNKEAQPAFKKITVTIQYDNGSKEIVVNKLKVNEIGVKM